MAGEIQVKELGAVAHEGGTQFGVWAPFAASVAVTGDFNNWSQDATHLENDGTGCWYADVGEAHIGQEYKFAIKNGETVYLKNDPRAMSLTSSNGNSVIADPNFNWSSDEFKIPPAQEQVIYELHVGTFFRPDPAASGTFESAAAKLDYLADLGINVIELMPIGGMPMGRGWGYAPDYIYAVEASYGGRKALQEFVDAAHQRGIAVMLDVVYNHFGPEGLDMWQFDGWSENGKGGIYFYNDWRSSTPWGDTRPDYGRPEVQQYILDNVRMWLRDCRIDGLRVDSTHFIRNAKGNNNDPSTDIPDGWTLLQKINAAARDENSSAIMIAEDAAQNEFITKPADQTGAGFTSQWETSFPYVVRDALEPISDADRNLGPICDTLAKRYNGDAFGRVVFSESHDMNANGRARVDQEISPHSPGDLFARRRSALGAAIVLTAPGIPMLFQGQEFMEDGSFNHWRALDWAKAERFGGILQLYKDLVALRRNQPGHTRGLLGQSFKVLHLHEDNNMMAYHRWDQGGAGDDVVIALNFANGTYTDYRIPFPRPGVWKCRFNSDWKGYSDDFTDTLSADVAVESDTGAINLGPYSVVIYSQD
jgi:1,4-alpha-glucan branching enzyme